MLKRCVTCHQERPLSDFNRRRAAHDGLQSRCRSCSKEWYLANRDAHMAKVGLRNARVRLANQALLGAYLLEHPCVDCGETDVRCLEFDHEDPAEKVMEVTRMVAHRYAWTLVLAEIAKCSIRCANCHRRRTAGMQGSWRQAFHEERAWDGAAVRLQALLARPG